MSTTLYRFTPPTCTLEIKGIKSPLSRWTNQDLLKKFQFQLSFDDPRLPASEQVTVVGNKADLEQLKTAVERYIQKYLHASLNSDNQSINPSQNNSKPYIQPNGLVNHQLFLGNLNSDAANNQVKLGTVQLFDLVTALEAYSERVAALPELKQTQTKKIIPLWGGIAAVTIAAVGISTIALKNPPQNVATSTQSESLGSIPELDEVIPPKIPEAAEKRASQPQLREPLTSRKRLPPPPAVDTPKPKPNIPDPADYPLSQVGKQSGLTNRVRDRENTKQQQETAILSKTKTKEKKITSNQNQVNSNSDSKTIITEQKQGSEDRSIKTEIVTQGEQELTDKKATAELPEDLVLSNPNSNTALNKISTQPNQLQEIKAYFKDRWQPPADLKQSLEYRLYLNSDGSIKKVIPLGKASKLYLSQTNIPVKGESFVSPFTQENLTIRLLLNPDGEVNAFKE